MLRWYRSLSSSYRTSFFLASSTLLTTAATSSYDYHRRSSLSVIKSEGRLEFAIGTVESTLYDALNTGDIILFSRPIFSISSTPLRSLLLSLSTYLNRHPYDHIGIIIKRPSHGNLPYLLEYHWNGPQWRPFDERFFYSRANNIIIKRLSGPPLSEEAQQRAIDYAESLIISSNHQSSLLSSISRLIGYASYLWMKELLRGIKGGFTARSARVGIINDEQIIISTEMIDSTLRLQIDNQRLQELKNKKNNICDGIIIKSDGEEKKDGDRDKKNNKGWFSWLWSSKKGTEKIIGNEDECSTLSSKINRMESTLRRQMDRLQEINELLLNTHSDPSLIEKASNYPPYQSLFPNAELVITILQLLGVSPFGPGDIYRIQCINNNINSNKLIRSSNQGGIDIQSGPNNGIQLGSFNMSIERFPPQYSYLPRHFVQQIPLIHGAYLQKDYTFYQTHQKVKKDQLLPPPIKL